ISYQDFTNGDLKVALCGNATCSSGNTSTTVDSPGSVGAHTSIAVLNGAPIISYWDFTNGHLKVALCGNPACNNGNRVTTVDSAPSVGMYTSIAIANGLPIVSYHDYGSLRLKLFTDQKPTVTQHDLIISS